MALTWFQRMKVALRGWSRRREEEDRKRQDEFLKRNVTWGATPPTAAAASAVPHRTGGAPAGARPLQIDREGLQVGYLDDSGRIAYYLDTQSGDVIESRDAATNTEMERSGRFRRVPARSDESDAEDRRAFVETLEPSRIRQSLSMTMTAHDFRKILATDRTIERAWYNFKNERATAAIESWLRGLGLS